MLGQYFFIDDISFVSIFSFFLDLEYFKLKTLAVFGSVARDEARQDSDVDILVEFQGPATFNGYMDLKFFLEDLLGCPVDLVTRKSVRPRVKAQIESEAQYVQGLSALSSYYYFI